MHFCLALQAVAVVGLILVFISFISGIGGWYIFVGFGYIVYVIIVFVIEMFLTGIYVHRLIVSYYKHSIQYNRGHVKPTAIVCY